MNNRWKFTLLAFVATLPAQPISAATCEDAVLRRLACVGETYCKCPFPKPNKHIRVKHEYTTFKKNPEGKHCDTVCYGRTPAPGEKNGNLVNIESAADACAVVGTWSLAPYDKQFFERAKTKCNECKNCVSAEKPTADGPNEIENENSSDSNEEEGKVTNPSQGAQIEETKEKSRKTCCTTIWTLPCYEIDPALIDNEPKVEPTSVDFDL